MGKKIINKQSPTCSGRWCQIHLFSIRPIYATLSNPKEDSVRLCPKHNKDKKTYEKVLPKLNLDGKFYTPTFILQEDERLYIDHDKSNLRNFEQNKFSQEEQISDIVSIFFNNSSELFFCFTVIMQMIPKVNSSTAFCRVCRQNYEDYLEHCSSVGHMSKVTKHPYSVFIVELVENFKTNGCKQTINQTPNSNSNFLKNNQICLDEEMESQLQDKETCFRLKQNYNQKADSRLEA